MRALPLLAAIAATLFAVPAKAEPPMLVTSPLSAAPANEAEPAPATAPAAPAAAAAAAAPVTVARPKPPSLIARINLATQRLELTVGGKHEQSWPISSGREGFPTPRGVFRPQWAAKLWHSRKYDMAPMPHAVFFSGGAAIHATQATGMLGQPASHGCVRLAPANAQRFYELVHKHGYQATRIEVFGTPPAPRIARRSVPEPRVAARRPSQVAAASGWGGWGQSPAAPAPAMQQATLRRAANGMVFLPPGSPHQGRASFVMNGVTYVRVR